ncbi:unnamed protein product [Meganyctiphanes norvegica]|uniref:Uncharacterized protein n=1 Tax=Meganyctiphanes norvegica TaxID=48144 RepID=A0AAV2QCL5_MEGNR
MLAIPSFEKPVDSLVDLEPAVKKQGFTLGTVRDSSFEFIFKFADGGIYQEVWKLFSTDRRISFFASPAGAFSQITTSKFIMVNARLNSMIRMTKLGWERYYMSRDSFYPQGYGIACNTGAPFKPIFDRHMLWLVEAGLVNKWAQDEIAKVRGEAEPVETGNGLEAISLEHTQAVFVIVILGHIFATGVFILEICLAGVCGIKEKEKQINRTEILTTPDQLY